MLQSVVFKLPGVVILSGIQLFRFFTTTGTGYRRKVPVPPVPAQPIPILDDSLEIVTSPQVADDDPNPLTITILETLGA